jgi:hypothetical protein
MLCIKDKIHHICISGDVGVHQFAVAADFNPYQIAAFINAFPTTDQVKRLEALCPMTWCQEPGVGMSVTAHIDSWSLSWARASSVHLALDRHRVVTVLASRYPSEIRQIAARMSISHGIPLHIYQTF